MLSQGLIAPADLEKARSEVEVNYFGVLSTCRAFASSLKQQGGGAILNVSSLLGRANLPSKQSPSSKASIVDQWIDFLPAAV
ncbi:MAG: SDR family NAD(P)-dependent oxidoreductase [Stenomitos rutilans HA7619-LM2]|nr:SDR family NAD(P)-dependent oxidoreductase [Stenomitos rutilans HA7619-LM2]